MMKNIYRQFKYSLMSQGISEDEAGRLIENRMEFKLYAAKQHLKNLKILEQNGSSMLSSKERAHMQHRKSKGNHHNL
jgi:hypothetical protein